MMYSAPWHLDEQQGGEGALPQAPDHLQILQALWNLAPSGPLVLPTRPPGAVGAERPQAEGEGRAWKGVHRLRSKGNTGLLSPDAWGRVQACPEDSLTPFPEGSVGPTPAPSLVLARPRDSPGRNTGMGCHFLLEGIFPTQGSNQGLLYCRETLY